MKKIRLGIVGCGPRGCSVLAGCLPIHDVEITAVSDLYSARMEEAQKLAASRPPQGYADFESMLRDAPIDAVHVAVEPENIPAVVVACLNAGKHVLSDVPMAYSLEEIWDIVLAVERSGTKYMLGEALRYWPFIEKWKQLYDDGVLGKIAYAEGQYLHGMGDDRYYNHPETHARLTIEEAAAHPNPLKSRAWNLSHPILYLPHTLSPLLRVLGERITSVVCMGNTKSHARPFFPHPDLETALMRTENDTVLRVSAGFTIYQPHKPVTMYHWYNLVGTRGSVETQRSAQDEMKIFHPFEGDKTARNVEESFWKAEIPEEAAASGHGGIDYWAFRHFFDCILKDVPPAMDVYQAAETAAPAILAARSAEQNSACLSVPDFRPGPARAVGQEWKPHPKVSA